MLAVLAPNPGETALQVAAVQELVDQLRDDGAQDAIARLIFLGITTVLLGVCVPSGPSLGDAALTTRGAQKQILPTPSCRCQHC